jgi:hypothetical protein
MPNLRQSRVTFRHRVFVMRQLKVANRRDASKSGHALCDATFDGLGQEQKVAPHQMWSCPLSPTYQADVAFNPSWPSDRPRSGLLSGGVRSLG